MLAERDKVQIAVAVAAADIVLNVLRQHIDRLCRLLRGDLLLLGKPLFHNFAGELQKPSELFAVGGVIAARYNQLVRRAQE